MNKRKLIVRGIIVAIALVLYPIFYLGGCVHGMTKAVTMSGFVNVADGMTATNFSESGPTVRVCLVEVGGRSPEAVTVEFKDLATGNPVSTTTVHAEANANGVRYFAFDFPNQFTDSVDKRLSATIHRQ